MLFKLSVSNLKKSIKDYAVYFFTLILGVAIFYIFNAIETQSAMLTISSDTREIIKLLTNMLSGVSVFVAFVLGFLIIYASNFLMKRRKKEFGLYILLGMGKRKVSFILFIETLIIGIISLGVGLLLGIGLSQVTSIFVANMFDVSIDKYRFVFSNTAFVKTLLYFVIIYVVVILFNTVCINRFKLIDLLTGGRKAEKATLKNPYICVVVFAIAVAMLAFAYYRVCDFNNITDAKKLACYIAMGCVGTFLFFWSLSGLLFAIVHSIKGVYFKGLNSFVFRQMSSRINSNVLSMTVICLMMFVTICVLSSGLTVRNSMANNLNELAAADVMVVKDITDVDKLLEDSSQPVDVTDNVEASQSQDTSSEDEYVNGKKRSYYEAFTDEEKKYSAMTLDEYMSVKGMNIEEKLGGYEKVNIYYSPDLVLGDTLMYANGGANDDTDNNDSDDVESSTGNAVNGYSFLYYYTTEDIISLSDYNRLAKLYGKETLTLADDEYAVVADFKNMVNIRNAAMENGMTISLNNRTLHAKSTKCYDGIVEMAANHINAGIFVVPDDAVTGLSLDRQLMSGNYNSKVGSDKEAIDSEIYAFGDTREADRVGFSSDTKLHIKDAAMGLGAMTAFIALYIGMIFLISGAAILALKELSESADNMGRYKILKNLGTDNRQINGAVLKQTTLFFGFPLLLAIVHSIFGMKVSYFIIEALGTEYMVQSIIMTAVLILIVYGGYFVITYNSCKNMIKDV